MEREESIVEARAANVVEKFIDAIKNLKDGDRLAESILAELSGSSGISVMSFGRGSEFKIPVYVLQRIESSINSSSSAEKQKFLSALKTLKESAVLSFSTYADGFSSEILAPLGLQEFSNMREDEIDTQLTPLLEEYAILQAENPQLINDTEKLLKRREEQVIQEGSDGNAELVRLKKSLADAKDRIDALHSSKIEFSSSEEEESYKQFSINCSLYFNNSDISTQQKHLDFYYGTKDFLVTEDEKQINLRDAYEKYLDILLKGQKAESEASRKLQEALSSDVSIKSHKQRLSELRDPLIKLSNKISALQKVKEELGNVLDYFTSVRRVLDKKLIQFESVKDKEQLAVINKAKRDEEKRREKARRSFSSSLNAELSGLRADTDNQVLRKRVKLIEEYDKAESKVKFLEEDSKSPYLIEKEKLEKKIQQLKEEEEKFPVRYKNARSKGMPLLFGKDSRDLYITVASATLGIVTPSPEFKIKMREALDDIYSQKVDSSKPLMKLMKEEREKHIREEVFLGDKDDGKPLKFYQAPFARLWSFVLFNTFIGETIFRGLIKTFAEFDKGGKTKKSSRTKIHFKNSRDEAKKKFENSVEAKRLAEQKKKLSEAKEKLADHQTENADLIVKKEKAELKINTLLWLHGADRDLSKKIDIKLFLNRVLEPTILEENVMAYDYLNPRLKDLAEYISTQPNSAELIQSINHQLRDFVVNSIATGRTEVFNCVIDFVKELTDVSALGLEPNSLAEIIVRRKSEKTSIKLSGSIFEKTLDLLPQTGDVSEDNIVDAIKKATVLDMDADLSGAGVWSYIRNLYGEESVNWKGIQNFLQDRNSTGDISEQLQGALQAVDARIEELANAQRRPDILTVAEICQHLEANTEVNVSMPDIDRATGLESKDAVLAFLLENKRIASTLVSNDIKIVAIEALKQGNRLVYSQLLELMTDNNIERDLAFEMDCLEVVLSVGGDASEYLAMLNSRADDFKAFIVTDRKDLINRLVRASISGFDRKPLVEQNVQNLEALIKLVDETYPEEKHQYLSCLSEILPHLSDDSIIEFLINNKEQVTYKLTESIINNSDFHINLLNKIIDTNDSRKIISALSFLSSSVPPYAFQKVLYSKDDFDLSIWDKITRTEGSDEVISAIQALSSDRQTVNTSLVDDYIRVESAPPLEVFDSDNIFFWIDYMKEKSKENSASFNQTLGKGKQRRKFFSRKKSKSVSSEASAQALSKEFHRIKVIQQFLGNFTRTLDYLYAPADVKVKPPYIQGSEDYFNIEEAECSAEQIKKEIMKFARVGNIDGVAEIISSDGENPSYKIALASMYQKYTQLISQVRMEKARKFVLRGDENDLCLECDTDVEILRSVLKEASVVSKESNHSLIFSGSGAGAAPNPSHAHTDKLIALKDRLDGDHPVSLEEVRDVLRTRRSS